MQIAEADKLLNCLLFRVLRRQAHWGVVLAVALSLPWAGATVVPRMKVAANANDHPSEVLSWRHQILGRDAYRALAREWEAYAESHPTDARALVEWGDALRYAGRFKEGVAKYAQAFAVDSTDAAAVAASEFFAGCHQEGAAWRLTHERLLRSVATDPEYPGTYYALTLTALRAGDQELADNCLRRLVELGDMPRPLLDMGRNMMVGAPPDAVIFTNGDNDTYPPLAYQALTGDRRDVAIVNLSLLNTQWFARHCRDHGILIDLTDEEISTLHRSRGGRLAGELQRHMLLNLERSGPGRPLYYSVTVAPANKVLPCSLVLEGLLERIVPNGKENELGAGGCNWVRMRELLDTVYRFDSALDPYLDWERESAVAACLRNYIPPLYRVGEWLIEGGAPREAEPYLYRAVALQVMHGDRGHAARMVDWWAETIPQGRLWSRARALLD